MGEGCLEAFSHTTSESVNHNNSAGKQVGKCINNSKNVYSTCGWIPVGEGAPLPVRCWAQGFRRGAFGAKAPASEAEAPPRRPILEVVKPAEAESSCCRQVQVPLHPGQEKQASQDEAPSRFLWLPSPAPSAGKSWKQAAVGKTRCAESQCSEKQQSRERWIWSCQIIPEKLATP